MKTPSRLRKTPSRKRFGQHFLADAAAVDRIFAALELRDTDAVLEIGPGTGVLTERLCTEARAVAAIEIDRDLAATLQARLPTARVICADALASDLAALVANRTNGVSANRVVGNLPYNIATPLLDRLFDLAERVADIHVMLQAEVAARLAAAPGSKAYGRLSVMAQYHCHVERLFDVRASSFAPPPKVDSTFVRLTARRREPCDRIALRQLLRQCFGQRRKTLGNAVRSLAPDWAALRLDPKRRPETLGLEEFVALANHCKGRLAASDTSTNRKRCGEQRCGS